jgi:hypothetical protein
MTIAPSPKPNRGMANVATRFNLDVSDCKVAVILRAEKSPGSRGCICFALTPRRESYDEQDQTRLLRASYQERGARLRSGREWECQDSLEYKCLSIGAKFHKGNVGRAVTRVR